jgi:hypothetical protein
VAVALWATWRVRDPARQRRAFAGSCGQKRFGGGASEATTGKIDNRICRNID